MRPLSYQIVTLSHLPVATATPAVHQSTAETWEPAAINRNRLEERCATPKGTDLWNQCDCQKERKRKIYLIDRVYLSFQLTVRHRVSSPDGKFIPHQKTNKQKTFRLHLSIRDPFSFTSLGEKMQPEFCCHRFRSASFVSFLFIFPFVLPQQLPLIRSQLTFIWIEPVCVAKML